MQADEYESLLSINAIMNEPEFHKPPGFIPEYLKDRFSEILDMSIVELHDIGNPELGLNLNPYMIGITYLHKYCLSTESFEDIDIPFDNVSIRQIVADWKNQEINAGKLTGIVFLSDNACKKSVWIQKLIGNRANPVGFEKKKSKKTSKDHGASYFVAKKMVVFAINKGIRANLKNNAAFHRIFTLSIAAFINDENKSITITARSLSDIKVIEQVVTDNMRIPASDNPQNSRNRVIIALGWEDFETDKALYKVGQKMAEADFPLVFYIRDKYRESLESVARIFESEYAWQRAIGVWEMGDAALLNADDKAVNSPKPWAFILSSVNAVYYTFNNSVDIKPNSLHIQPTFCTIPVPSDSKEPQNASQGTSECSTQRPSRVTYSGPPKRSFRSLVKPFPSLKNPFKRKDTESSIEYDGGTDDEMCPLLSKRRSRSKSKPRFKLTMPLRRKSQGTRQRPTDPQPHNEPSPVGKSHTCIEITRKCGAEIELVDLAEKVLEWLKM